MPLNQFEFDPTRTRVCDLAFFQGLGVSVIGAVLIVAGLTSAGGVVMVVGIAAVIGALVMI